MRKVLAPTALAILSLVWFMANHTIEGTLCMVGALIILGLQKPDR